MPKSVAQKYMYADLTWPEVNEAVEMGKVVLLPVGSIEQHGRHLPLDCDLYLAWSCCVEAGRRLPEKILVAPGIPYGYIIHAMDFPGTVHVGHDHFLGYCLDVLKSFAYHGFKRIIIVNGHGSNEGLLDYAGRRTILETDALVAWFEWIHLLKTDPGFVKTFRESVYPGGCGHSDEVETSVMLHLCGDRVQMDKAEDHIAWWGHKGAPAFQYDDMFGCGPVNIVEWTSSYAPSGVTGQPTLATAEKGRRIFEEAVSRLVQFTAEFRDRPAPPRVDHHTRPPSSPLPSI